jgi:hypothetical protein
MGSGGFASAGFGKAAFQALVDYFTSSTTSAIKDATLTAVQPSPTCYTDVLHNNSGAAGYRTYFYFGGPGGAGC